MDKRIVYAGAIPVDLDWLEPQRNAEYAIGYLAQACLGTSTIVDGLAVTQQASPNMTVQVGAGSIISLTTVDPTGVAYGALTLDANNLVKIGVNKTVTNMSALTAPGTVGQSQNWLLEGKFLEADGSAVVLPYYNASNPTLPYTGPANAGTSQSTRRTNTVQLQWKAGTAATTGTQVTPSPDSGWTGIAVVTIANGQASILNANITTYVNAPIVPTKLSVQRIRLFSNLNLYVSPTGSDGSSGLSASVPLLTINKAWNILANNYDLNGFSATINLASGSYAAFSASAPIPGASGPSNVIILGNTGSPSSMTIAGGATDAVQNIVGAVFSVQGVTMTTSGAGASCLNVTSGVVNFGNVVFGATGSGGNHIGASSPRALVQATAAYSITGAAGCHVVAAQGALSLISGVAVTITGTPAIGTFALATTAGQINAASSTFTGAATGIRYNATSNAVINTNGGASTLFPGSVAGSVATQGLYV